MEFANSSLMPDARAQRLRLLFLLPYAPRLDAVNGSGRAMAQLIQALVPRHDVAVCYVRGIDEKPMDRRLASSCMRVEAFYRSQPQGAPWAAAHRLRLLAALFNRTPLWVADWSVPTLRHRLPALLTGFQPHVVQIEYHLMGQYLDALAGSSAPRVLVQHEPASRAAPYVRALPPVFNRLANYLDRRAWRSFEPSILQQVHAIVAFTEQDRQALLPTAGSAPIFRIPLSAVVAKPLDPLGAQPPNLLFVGNFKHAPNVDAALWLVETLLPLVQPHCPDVHLNIVGSDPPHELQARAAHNVCVTGFVPNVKPYLDRASVVVIPLRLGGGMRVKVLEALSAGKAVVASPRAVEGLRVKDGEQLRIAQDPDAFAAATLDLLHDARLRRQMATAAHRWARANLSWEDAVTAYEALYARLLHEAKGAAVDSPALLHAHSGGPRHA